MNLVLVDDHLVVRKGLRTLLEEDRRYHVVGEAGSGAEAVDLIGKLRPHVAVLDIKLPDMSGFQVAKAVKTQSPDTRIIMLSMHADEFHVNEALRSGADGYVVKNAMENEIIDAIGSVQAGKRYVSQALAESVSENSPGYRSARIEDPYLTLTKREREILCLIAQGKLNRQIAEQLFISLRTVHTHRARIMRKLRLRTAAELIHFAIRRNLINVA
jgi:DNA-binding NarL/FixJ family response regulator